MVPVGQEAYVGQRSGRVESGGEEVADATAAGDAVDPSDVVEALTALLDLAVEADEDG